MALDARRQVHRNIRIQDDAYWCKSLLWTQTNLEGLSPFEGKDLPLVVLPKTTLDKHVTHTPWTRGQRGVLPLQPIFRDDWPHPLYLPIHKRGMASLVLGPWVTFVCREEFNHSLVDSSEDHLQGTWGRASIPSSCWTRAGRHHHDSRAPNDDQGGGRTVGECRRQKSVVFSVGGS